MSFLDHLKTKFSKELAAATQHKLTEELCNGTLSDAILYTYLDQDLKFFLHGLRSFSRTMSLCDNEDAVVALGKQIGFFCNDENDYFRLTLKELEETSKDKLYPSILQKPSITLPEVEKYNKRLQDHATPNANYVENITCLYMAELIYLMWAEEQGGSEEHAKSLPYKYKGWIDLHRGEDFSKWVDFLGAELERVAKSDSDKKLAERAAVQTMQLEFEFFESCYTFKE